jgi:hypothetical protein
MKVIGLFSGIGGFELAFQREGFEVVSVCEIDPYCQKVLKAHFPKARLNPDIRLCSLGDFLARTYPSPDAKSASLESEVVSGLSFSRRSDRYSRTGLSSKTSDILGGSGCPQCVTTSPDSDTSHCHFACAPLTWEPPINVPESSLLPTPTASSYGSCRGGGSGRVGKWRASLSAMAKHNKWPTPRATDGEKNVRSKAGALKEVKRKGISGVDLHAAVLVRSETDGGQLNPEWVEWLMGYPIGWTALEPSATPSSRKSRKSSRGESK